ncbi:hypothetical protein NLJ89_g6314 [Agrocybe chaxingu]|uniref:Uncharacterized protein n=1 Tax=Agrocybe chaxingu TaxID=84603 RepID=A0A9W8JYW0_9AGAR|nr:hypothetical protein NLJ89_g6314 [Agrocybe chaxingu]
MSNSGNENGNGTPRSSHLSPISATLSPTWRPPKSPLPPHRLAKLANALGVSTPVPASHNSSSFLSRSFSETASSIDHLRRSPTPSTAASSMGFSSYTPTTSKFLLHVIPPMHLPHDSDNLDDMTSPPAPNAPGYHTQFRRGTLVPVHSTLQGQLGAIAKEYALPSSTGLILYLVTNTATSPSPQSSEGMDEPGPRLSEEIWRHLWTRVLRTEQRDDLLLPSLSPNPQTPRTPQLLGLGPASRSTPFLPQENPNSPLRPLITSPMPEPLPSAPHAPQPMYPITTAPSTPSSASDIRSNNKSAPPSSVSQSEPGTPDTSVEDAGIRANSLDLPGLNSPSLIPILAKVEFDIDRRKAGWYEPWIRSRKANHAKRTGNSRKNSSTSRRDSEEGNGSRERAPPIELIMGRKKKLDPFGLGIASDEPKAEQQEENTGYARLSESPQDLEDSDNDSEHEDLVEDATAKVSSFTGGKDPLDDVFGTDADTWVDIRAENGDKPRNSNSNIVDLALTGEELSRLPDDFEDDDSVSTKEEDEVREILDKMGKPQLAVSIPSPERNKKVPPPLVLKPHDAGTTVVSSQPSPSPAVESAGLAYLRDSPDEDDANRDGFGDDLGEYSRVRSPAESEKRGGAVFDDLDLGLDPTEDFDDNDPNDHRRSQYLLRAQLDEIERTMAQLSPRMLKTDLEEEQSFSFHSANLSTSSSPTKLTLSPGSARRDFFPPLSPPRLPRHPDPPETPTEATGQSWPAVPFSQIKEKVNADAPPSPPRLAVNGITTSAPKSYKPTYRPSAGPSETEKRKKELEDETTLYPPVAPAKRNDDPTSESPVIPLSPDPFGRYPSTPEPYDPRSSGTSWDTMTIGRGSTQTLEIIAEGDVKTRGRGRSGTTTSRFSADSLNGEEVNALAAKSSNRSTLMSVKSIRKLWRKSNTKSISSTASIPPPTPTATSSGRTSPVAPPQRPERPSQEPLDLPDMPDIRPPSNFGRLSPQPNGVPPQVPRGSQDQLHPGRRPSQDFPLPPPPSRPSLDQASPSAPQFQQLAVPSFPGRNGSPAGGPIITPHMQASRSASNLDRLHFDQESPYPIRRSPPARQSPRPPSPPPLPAIPEQEKNVARKSILKWKSSSNISSNSNGAIASSSTEPQPRSSFERPGANGNSRGRRPSVINFGSTRSSVTSPELPPSPQIPSQFINAKNGAGGLEQRSSQRSKLTASSTSTDLSYSPPQQGTLGTRSTSPPRSMTSSRDSQETRPSFDASQFEFVSPKAGTLTYPYNSLDQQ